MHLEDTVVLMAYVSKDRPLQYMKQKRMETHMMDYCYKLWNLWITAGTTQITNEVEFNETTNQQYPIDIYRTSHTMWMIQGVFKKFKENMHEI